MNGKSIKYETSYQVQSDSLKLFELYRIFKSFAPDIIYWRYNRTSLLKTVMLGNLFGIKIVFAVSGPNDLRIKSLNFRTTKNRRFRRICGSLRNITYDWVNQFAFYFIDTVTVQLNNQKNILPVDNEILISNSVSVKVEQCTWPRPFIIWVSNIKDGKNPLLYLDLARKVKNKSIDFLMIGAIQDATYKKYFEVTSTPENFHFLGPKSVEETNGFIQNSMFLVHTCDPEGFPNIFMQAWALGKPTISLYYDPDSFIEENNIGAYSRSFDKLVEDVESFISNEPLRFEAGERARYFSSSERFDPMANAKKLERSFNLLIESK